MKERNQLTGACGYDCRECAIFRAPSNPGTAHKAAESLKKQHGIEVRPQDIRCLGCKGDRATHWNAECWILQCCVDRKGLEFCYQCQAFQCDKLNGWAKGTKRYAEALSRLKGIKRGEHDTS